MALNDHGDVYCYDCEMWVACGCEPAFRRHLLGKKHLLNIRSRTKTHLIPGEFSHTVRINMDIPALVPSEDDVPSLVAEDSVLIFSYPLSCPLSYPLSYLL